MFKFLDVVVGLFESIFNTIKFIITILIQIVGTLASGVTMFIAFLFTLPPWLSGGLISIFFIVVAFALINIVRGA